MKSYPHAQSKLVSPSGRDVAQRQRGLVSAMFFLRCLMRTGQRPALSVNSLMRSLYKILPSRTIQTCLSLRERCRAATERACIDYVLSPVCLMRTDQRPALSVNSLMRSLYKILPSRTIQTCLSLWERCRAATERACISYVLSPVCLMQTGQHPALSVNSLMRSLYEILPSRTVQTCLSLWERCRAATERAYISYVLSPAPDSNRSASCPLSHLLCKCQLSQRGEKFVRTGCSHRLVFTQRAVLPHGRA